MNIPKRPKVFNRIRNILKSFNPGQIDIVDSITDLGNTSRNASEITNFAERSDLIKGFTEFSEFIQAGGFGILRCFIQFVKLVYNRGETDTTFCSGFQFS